MQNHSPTNTLPRTTRGAIASVMLARVVLASVVLPASAALAGPLPKEAGVWFDDTGKGAVKIELCGSKLCGRIVWLKSLVNDKGEALIDRHNPDASLKARPICGLQILGQLDQMPEGGFDNGWIYDPKEGKSYSLALTLSGPDELSVTGYKGVKFLSKTFVWKRAKTELPSCAQAPTEAKAPGNSAVAPAAAAAATGAAAKTAPKAPSTAASAPASKPAKAGTAEALPWSGGGAQKPAAKPLPQGASNLGATKLGVSKPVTPKSPAVKPAAVKSSIAKPAASQPAAAKASAIAPAKPAVAKPKPAFVEPIN